MKIYNEIKLAQELIRFPTIKTEDKGIIKSLSRKLSSIGFKCKIIKSKGTGQKPALNLYAKLGNSKPHINFLGHTDVVANLNNWKIPPYSVVVPGSLPNKNNSSAPSLYCAVIIKQVDEKTRSKTSINDLLRD